MSISVYMELKSKCDEARRWFAMFGKRYHGGGGGNGSLRALTVTATMYYQERDGSTNYHEAPEAFRFAFAKEVARRFVEISAAACAQMDADLLVAAKCAADEHTNLMRAAGLIDEPEATP